MNTIFSETKEKSPANILEISSEHNNALGNKGKEEKQVRERQRTSGPGTSMGKRKKKR